MTDKDETKEEWWLPEDPEAARGKEGDWWVTSDPNKKDGGDDLMAALDGLGGDNADLLAALEGMGEAEDKTQPEPDNTKEEAQEKPKAVISDSDDDDEDAAEAAGDDDAEAKALLEKYASTAGDVSVSSSSSSDSDDQDMAREIELEDNVLDHVVLAAPDIDTAVNEFEGKTGIRPRMALAIKGLGIKSARVSFEGSSYLDIIAPDPDRGGPIGDLLRASGVKQRRPFHWAIRTSRAEELAKDASR